MASASFQGVSESGRRVARLLDHVRWAARSRMKRFSLPLLVVVLLPTCSVDNGMPSVSLVRDSRAASLSSDERSALRDGVESILSSCNNNSDEHKGAPWWPVDLREEWSRRLAADHLLVRYPSSQIFETFAGTVEVRELLLPLPPGQIPAQPLTRVEQDVVGYSKCSGTLIVQFSCSHPVEPLMPVAYHEFCEQYRESASPSDTE